MKIGKKYIAAIMAILMLIGTYQTVFAADEVKTEKDNFFTEWEEKGAQITSIGSGIEENVNWECFAFDASVVGLIPGKWKTLVFSGSGMIGPFKSEGLLPLPEGSLSDGKTPWGSCNEEIKMIFIEEGVTGIGEMAFSEVHSTCIMYVPQSVTTIGDGAIGEGITIYGLPRGAAELYASQNGNDFNCLGDNALCGDTDGNGKLEAADALAILKMVVGMEPVYKWTGDVNGDKCVTAEDALFILKKVVGLN